ncbi:MAG: hypothetical protein MZW92_57385 [Comamonadaceae bacterium]|nr:hypothetical protein [Comamonadaceae bacterium]
MLTLATLSTLTACGGDDDGPAEPTAPSFAAIELAIAHVNDHHSQLEGFADTTLTLDGTATRVTLGGFARLTTVFDELAGTPNLLEDPRRRRRHRHALLHPVQGRGRRADDEHRLLRRVRARQPRVRRRRRRAPPPSSTSCAPAVARRRCWRANVRPAIGTPLAPQRADDYIRPYVIREFEGVKVGLIGIDHRRQDDELVAPAGDHGVRSTRWPPRRR